MRQIYYVSFTVISVFIVGLFLFNDKAPRTEPSFPAYIKEFTLLDVYDRPFTKDTLKDQWTVVFFGFTNCPDICPTTLQMMAQVAKDMKKTPRDNPLQFVFISLDPERDTPKKISKYVSHFSDDILGVTGSYNELYRLIDSLEARDMVRRHSDGNNDYTIDHPIGLYVFNPKGLWAGVIEKPTTSPHTIAKSINKKMSTL